MHSCYRVKCSREVFMRQRGEHGAECANAGADEQPEEDSVDDLGEHLPLARVQLGVVCRRRVRVMCRRRPRPSTVAGVGRTAAASRQRVAASTAVLPHHGRRRRPAVVLFQLAEDRQAVQIRLTVPDCRHVVVLRDADDHRRTDDRRRSR